MRIPLRLLASVAAGATLVSVLSACGASPTQKADPSAPGGGASAADLASKVDATAAINAGPVGKDLPSTPTLDRIRQQGFLKFAGSRNTLGFSLQDPKTGDIHGFDAAIAKSLAKYLIGKPEAKLQSGGSDTREALLANHTIDVAIQTYTITAPRKKLVNFSEPYYRAAEGILVNEGDTSIKQASDLGGKNVCTESGAAKNALLDAVPTAKAVLFDSSHTATKALQQHRCVAVVLNNASLLGVSATVPGVTLLKASLGENMFGIGIAKDDPKFKEIVDGFLKQIETDGTWTKIWTSTVGVLLKTAPPEPPKFGYEPPES